MSQSKVAIGRDSWYNDEYCTCLPLDQPQNSHRRSATQMYLNLDFGYQARQKVAVQ